RWHTQRVSKTRKDQHDRSTAQQPSGGGESSTAEPRFQAVLRDERGGRAGQARSEPWSATFPDAHRLLDFTGHLRGSKAPAGRPPGGGPVAARCTGGRRGRRGATAVPTPPRPGQPRHLRRGTGRSVLSHATGRPAPYGRPQFLVAGRDHAGRGTIP